MTGISRLTEADKICVSVVDLSVILIEAVETLLNCALDFREPGKISHIAPSLLQKLQDRDRPEGAWLFRARKCLLCTSGFLEATVSRGEICIIPNLVLVKPRASARASPSHVSEGKNRSSFFL